MLRKIKLITSAVCCALTVCTFAGCEFSFDLFSGSSQSSSHSGFFEPPSWNEPSGYTVDDNMEQYDYSLKNTLTDNEKNLYNHIKFMLDNKQTSFDFENITNDDFKKAYYATFSFSTEVTFISLWKHAGCSNFFLFSILFIIYFPK